MHKPQELHLKHIKKAFERLADHKYRAGALEHGGNLWELEVADLLLNGLDEVIDAYVYLLTAIDKIKWQEQQKGIDKPPTS